MQLVDGLQSRLRRVVGQVAASSSRPKVLSLEGLQPLVLGKYSCSPSSERSATFCFRHLDNNPFLEYLSWEVCK